MNTPPEMWSGKRGSNSRPQPWQGCALPTELFPLCPVFWRRDPESNRTDRICNPGHNRFAIAPQNPGRDSVETDVGTSASIKKGSRGFPLSRSGAGNEARTRDLNLGKVALYQLSYSRFAFNSIPLPTAAFAAMCLRRCAEAESIDRISSPAQEVWRGDEILSAPRCCLSASASRRPPRAWSRWQPFQPRQRWPVRPPLPRPAGPGDRSPGPLPARGRSSARARSPAGS